MVIGAEAWTTSNQNTSRMLCIIKLSAPSDWMQKQTCQNPFSAVVTMFITEGVYGRRRQGLDHKQPKHLKSVLHKQIETTAKTFRLQVLRGGGGSISQLSPFLLVCPQFRGLLWWVTMGEV